MHRIKLWFFTPVDLSHVNLILHPAGRPGRVEEEILLHHRAHTGGPEAKGTSNA